MINAIRAESVGVKDGKLILRFLGDDQKRYDVALTARAVADAFVVLLQQAKDLPVSDQMPAEGTFVEAALQFAIGDQMKPLLVLRIGGMEIPLGLGEPELVALHADISQFLNRTLH